MRKIRVDRCYIELTAIEEQDLSGLHTFGSQLNGEKLVFLPKEGEGQGYLTLSKDYTVRWGEGPHRHGSNTLPKGSKISLVHAGDACISATWGVSYPR